MPNLAIFVSGGGSNLQTLLNSNAKDSIKIVIADRPAFGLERAEKAGIETELISRKELGKNKLSAEIDKVMAKYSIDLIILAGYLSIFTEDFSAKWRGKMINIHPSLLPKYGGMGMYGIRVHRAVLEAGDRESGCTVHYLGEGVDNGEIIMQSTVPVRENDTPESLQKRVLAEEHQLLPKAVEGLLK